MAITTEIATNTTIRHLMIKSCFFSSMSFTTWPLRRSRVRVELLVRTSEERVDMEAERTRTTTTAIRKSGRPESEIIAKLNNCSERLRKQKTA
jgi:hypothetical protein